MSDYSKLTVVKLKELLKERSLPVTGKKADLVERLEANDAQEEDLEVEKPGSGDTEAPVAIESTEPASAPAVELEANVQAQSTTEPETTVDAEDKQEQASAGKSPEAQDEPAAAVAETEDVSKLAVEGNAADAEQSPDATAVDQTDFAPTVSELAPQTLDTASSEQPQSSSTPTPQGPTPTSGQQVMPAPEIPASQMPRPSIETQQTQEPESYAPQSSKSEGGLETLTRSTTMSTVNTQELFEDSKKRKRRSHSPPITSEEVALKKAKAVDGSPRATVVQNGVEVLPAQDDVQMEEPEPQNETRPTQPEPIKPTNDNRFKNLLPTEDTSTSKPESQPIDDDRSIAPSRHAPTKCLYISNLMRPLQPNALRTHLETLAKPPTSEDNEEVSLFFLESTRRYGLASFSSTSAASRTRSNLHGLVWPDESNRKALFVDFVPEELATELIALEESNANKPRLDRKRYEILYIDRDGETIAEIHDADSTTAQQHRNGQANAPFIHPQRKASIQSQKPSTLPPPPREETGKNFKALDELFLSTTAKPRLYYLEVSETISRKRLDTLSEATRRGESRSDILATDEKRRYTFEDGDIVDKGPEFGFGRGGAGGGRGRGGAFADRGGYRGRGRGGGGYRGDYRGDRGDYRSGAGIGYHDRW